MARILIVDDDIGIRELVKEILSEAGHEVSAAESAAKARIAFESSHPDVVLLDIVLPDEDGITLLKEWTDSHPATRIIMLSGHGTIDGAVEATRGGAVDFLEKPIALQRLLAAVQQAVRSRPSVGPLKPEGTAKVALGNGRKPSWADLALQLPLREAREEFERAYFTHALDAEGGSMARVAKRSGLERTQLYRKLRQLGIQKRRR